MKIKIFSIFLFFGAFVFFGAGCIQIQGGGTSAADGGIYKSVDKGVTWTQKASVSSVGGAKTIGNANVKALVMDPSDNKAIYALIAEGGVYYTYDGAESWNRMDALTGTVVNAFLVDQRNKCALFAAIGSKVTKSIDCGRTWVNVYLDSRAQQTITALVQNPANGNLIYLSTSSGDLIKSIDSGASWSPVNVFNGRIVRIIVDPYNSSIIYVGMLSRGIYKSVNGGESWEDLGKTLNTFPESLKLVDLVGSRSESDTYIHVSRYGLLKTIDGGKTWKSIELLTPPGTTNIYSLAIDPKDGKIIYYSTGSTFYKSIDGGVKWSTKKLPTLRTASALLIDPDNTSILYMGALRIKQ